MLAILLLCGMDSLSYDVASALWLLRQGSLQCICWLPPFTKYPSVTAASPNPPLAAKGATVRAPSLHKGVPEVRDCSFGPLQSRGSKVLPCSGVPLLYRTCWAKASHMERVGWNHLGPQPSLWWPSAVTMTTVWCWTPPIQATFLALGTSRAQVNFLQDCIPLSDFLDLLVSDPCLPLDGSDVTLQPNTAFLPKILACAGPQPTSTTRSVHPSSGIGSDIDTEGNLQSDQLFLCYSDQNKGCTIHPEFTEQQLYS